MENNVKEKGKKNENKLEVVDRHWTIKGKHGKNNINKNRKVKRNGIHKESWYTTNDAIAEKKNRK